MYEFSAATTFNGRRLVIDNETQPMISRRETTAQALFELTPAADGRFAFTLDRPNGFPALSQWDDFEAAASDTHYIYLLGSHSLSSDGFRRPRREVLLRLKPDGRDGPAEIVVYERLMPSLIRLARDLSLSLASAAQEEGGTAETVIQDLNFEGMEIASARHATTDLLLGLRSPVVSTGQGKPHHALILRLHDVESLFQHRDRYAYLTEEARLNLRGSGIAAIERDIPSGGYLIAAAPLSESNSRDYSSLWLWKPEDERQPLKEIMRFEGHKLEGINRTTSPEGKSGVLLAFDEEQIIPGADNGEVRRWQFGRLLFLERDRFE
jgi:hypothetical protein